MARFEIKGIQAFFANVYLALVLRISLGAMFVVSAQAKLTHHTDFVQVVKDYDLLPDALASVCGNTLPWVELLVGMYLLLAILTRPSAAVALLMGISFMVANIAAIVRGDESCGNCFGEMVTIPVGQAIALDAFIIFAALILAFFGSQKQLVGLDTLFSRKRENTLVDPSD